MRRRSRSLRASGEHASGDAVRRRRCNTTHKTDPKAAKPHKKHTLGKQKSPRRRSRTNAQTHGKQETPTRGATDGKEGSDEGKPDDDQREEHGAAQPRGHSGGRDARRAPAKRRGHRAAKGRPRREEAGEEAPTAQTRRENNEPRAQERRHRARSDAPKAARPTSPQERQEAAKLKSGAKADGERNGSEAAQGQ